MERLGELRCFLSLFREEKNETRETFSIAFEGLLVLSAGVVGRVVSVGMLRACVIVLLSCVATCCRARWSRFGRGRWFGTLFFGHFCLEYGYVVRLSQEHASLARDTDL